MGPAWTQFESTYKEKLEIVYINVDEKETAEYKKFESFCPPGIPTTIWFKGGQKPVETKTGSLSVQELTSISEQTLAK